MKRLAIAAVLLAGAARGQPLQSHAALPSGNAPGDVPGDVPGRMAEPLALDAFSPAQRGAIVQILRDALHSDPSILRDALTALQQDDLHQQEAAVRVAITAQRAALTANPADPTAGPADGDVTLVEFYDTRCPYCRRLLPTMTALLQADARLRVVYKDLPILGPNSVLEARALLAAQRQGAYARMQDAVMREAAPSTLQTLRAAAERLGLDGARLQQDMADPAVSAQLEANLQLARTLHVEGTPAFVVGARLIPGAVELADLQEAVTTARAR